VRDGEFSILQQAHPLTMRRIANLHAGEAKTDAGDGAIIAEAARSMRHTLRSLRLVDEQLAELERPVLAHPLRPVLTAMPGAGVRTAARLLTEVAP
jgi:transposase